MRVSDNGPELTGMIVLRFSQERQIRVALHRARQADSERVHRKFQRPAARQTPQ
jgi:hypothetical protein